MKKSKKAILVTALVLGLFANVSFAGTYGGGSGTEALPYQIGSLGNWEELTTTSGDWTEHFELTTDLDFDGISLTPVGNSSTPFSGIFDGQGHVISNFVINLPDNDYVGLFGKFAGVQIRNLGVENVNVTGDNNVGILAGGNGYNGPSLITSCYAIGTVTSSTGYYVGGLVGHSGNDVNMTSCYAKAVVSGNEYVGGLTGGGNSQFLSCYATGTVTGSSYVGGLIGNMDGSETNFCFWDVNTSGVRYSDGGIGLPTAVMQDSEIYLRAFWDFKGEIKNGTDDTWAMPQGGGYPVLAWQLAASPLSNDEMSNATAVTTGSAVSATSVGATGLDITRNGYNDLADVWYYFDCSATGNYTVTVEPDDFDSTVAVFDERQTEIAFNDYFFGGKSVVILRGEAGQRYYIRAGGHDGQTGSFTLTVEQGAVQTIQGDLNYDGMVDLVDFVIFAGQWLEGV